MPQIVVKTIQAHIAYYDKEFCIYLHLALKRRDNDIKYPSIWQAITGTFEGLESSIECMKREVEEETGIIVEKVWFLPYITTFYDPNKDNIHHAPVFGILVDSKEIKLSDEHIEFDWLLLNEAVKYYNLPSHKEAAKVFDEYILNSNDEKLFRVDI
jgi:8-oxo-dGTP pyrophosphatase MutT (NUDIX family)